MHYIPKEVSITVEEQESVEQEAVVKEIEDQVNDHKATPNNASFKS
jgi:hypothetical protein